MPDAPAEVTVLSKTLSKHLKKIKGSGGNKVVSTGSKKKSPKNPESAENVENSTENVREAKAKAFKNDGNGFFRDGFYAAAHLAYTKSIGAACKPITKAMAYANRSAALFHLGLIKDCINDVDQAIEHGYPPNLQYVLLVRKARCYKFGNNGFYSALQDARQSIKMHNPEAEEKLLKTIEEDLAKHERATLSSYCTSALIPNYFGELPQLSYGVNKEVPCLSSAVSIAYSKELGRHLIANQDIRIDDVVVVEMAFCHSLAPETALLFCAYCFMQCFSAIPCKDCEYAFYCNKECQELDWQSHRYSCKLVSSCFSNCSGTKPTNNFSPPQDVSIDETIFAFVFRLISKLGPDKILQHMNAPPPDWKQPAKYLSPSCESPLDALLNLTDHMGKVNCKEMKVHSSVALQTASSFGLSLEKRDMLAAVVLKMILVAKYNNKEIMHLTMDMTSCMSLQTRTIGTGIYLASSLINHSCFANTMPVFYGTTAVFKAIKPIKAGEQLTQEYLVSISAPASKRQDIFSSVHRFTCTCVACKEGWSGREIYSMNEEELGLVLDDIGLNDPFWIRFLMGLGYNTLFEFSFFKEFLHQILIKFIDDGKQRCRIFFNLHELLCKHMALQGNATISSFAQYLISNRVKQLEEEFQMMEIANSIGEEENLNVDDENAPDENGVSSSNGGSANPAEMLKITFPVEPEELNIVSKGDEVKLLENVTADDGQSEST